MEGSTTTTCALQNSEGDIKGAWINHFVSSNAYCAETEAAIQVLTIASKLNV